MPVRAPALGETAATVQERAHTTELVQVEDDVLGWMAAADPRLAARTGAVGAAAVLERIGDGGRARRGSVARRIVGSSLDLFAFRARAHALDEAGKLLAALHAPLPETGPSGARWRGRALERELLDRLVAEERARAVDEAQLRRRIGRPGARHRRRRGRQPARPQDVEDRDVWVSGHLLEIRESLRPAGPRTGPPDLDIALYPLERLLAPLQFPRGSAAIAQVRMTLDADMRAVPRLRDAARVARSAKVHLGVDVDPAAMPARLERARDAAARPRAARPRPRGRRLPASRRGPGARAAPRRAALPGGARHAGARSWRPRRSARPRAASSARSPRSRSRPRRSWRSTTTSLLSFAAVVPAPPPRTGLLSHPADDDVDALERMARERPVMVLGAALAAELVYGADGAEDRIAAWRALGEAPLDVVTREMASARR